jgi:hypothetical protein
MYTELADPATPGRPFTWHTLAQPQAARWRGFTAISPRIRLVWALQLVYQRWLRIR